MARSKAAAELRDIHEAVFGGERGQEYVLRSLVEHFTAEELLALARTLATAEGQSALQKQPQFMLDNMRYGAGVPAPLRGASPGGGAGAGRAAGAGEPMKGKRAGASRRPRIPVSSRAIARTRRRA